MTTALHEHPDPAEPRSERKEEPDGADEREIFAAIAALTASPGYVHALAYLCFVSGFAEFPGEVGPRAFLSMHARKRLTRTETTTLLGLASRKPLDFSKPETAAIRGYIKETERLMEQLHRAVARPLFEAVARGRLNDPGFDPFREGEVLREPMFYWGESGYAFQLRDFAVPKYEADDEWLREHKGFRIEDARAVVRAAMGLQNLKVTRATESHRAEDPLTWPLLDALTLSARDIAELGGLEERTVRNVMGEFSQGSEERNEGFTSIAHFNTAVAAPMVRLGEDLFVLFDQTSLAQALYEAPFYWMTGDPGYRSIAMHNRGNFTEQFVHDRLKGVFGPDSVFRGVKVIGKSGKDLTDIDILVKYGNRAIVVQAKSKRLTLKARSGDDGQIRSDFQQAIQHAYDQGHKAADALGETGVRLRDDSDRPITMGRPKEVVILTAISDPYPSLSLQASVFLQTRTGGRILPPVIADVFSIDAMTEMLDSPLWLMSYVLRRSKCYETLIVPDEMAALSFHLRHNLWQDERFDRTVLTEDASADLQAAMIVRREGYPGESSPTGVLTYLPDQRSGDSSNGSSVARHGRLSTSPSRFSRATRRRLWQSRLVLMTLARAGHVTDSTTTSQHCSVPIQYRAWRSTAMFDDAMTPN